jgi:hypothetical protein
VEGGPTIQYSQAKYVEVSNNSDQTIYLDGKILATGLWYVTETPGGSSEGRCAELERWRLDPEGIWSERHLRFPGSGALHRLRPGEAAVIAITAIDHGEIHDGFPDLSDADFEIVGPGQDVDNPNVPNMIDVGLKPAVDALGRGYLFVGRVTLMIVDNVDLESLPTDRLPLSDPDYRRFPADEILGLATLMGSEDLGNTRRCDQIVNERFDRQEARIIDEIRGNSVQRKVLGISPEGLAILQRTNTSAADFERRTRSPGRVP